MTKYSAIIVAAGSGTRAGGSLPKQFQSIGQKPMLQYTLDAFLSAPIDEYILVLSKDAGCIMNQHDVSIDFKGKEVVVVEGGKERTDSVYAGLCAASGEYVLIQDGARPFTSAAVIERCMEDVQIHRACVAAVPITDTVKRAGDRFVEETLDRSKLWAMQTPQCFERKLLKSCYNKMFNTESMAPAIDKSLRNNQEQKKPTARGKTSSAVLTDDAMIVEAYADVPVYLTKGDPLNIKVTTPTDFVLAEALCATMEM